jgi:hypothetical protein
MISAPNFQEKAEIEFRFKQNPEENTGNPRYNGRISGPLSPMSTITQ